MSSKQLSTIDSQFAISTLPKNRSLASSSKIDSLYEIEYIPGDRLPETTLPLVNPYDIFTKKPSLFSMKGVNQIIKPSSTRRVKEYVQSSKFSSCQIPATEEEQFISLNIPENMPRTWLQEGFTHLHYGVVRIGLTLHARKGLPVTARIALIDSRLKTYQHACIGTVQTTLNAGTVFVTLFPNFNISLKDPNLLKTLKVQLQIVGAPMQENSVVATLHHQIVYRIQDHALDLVLPSSDEALFLEVSSASQAPNSIQIPRQISREELLKKLPESWVTSYEKLHQTTQAPIQSTEVSFHPRSDGTTEIKFERPRSSTSQKPIFTQFMIELPEFEGPFREQIPKPISFGQNGSVLWPFMDENGHKYFDIDCDCSACLEDEYESEEEIRQRRRKKKDPLYKRYLEGDPSVGPLGEENGRYEYIVSYGNKKQAPPSTPTPEIMMFSPSDFPPYDDFNKHNIDHSPKVIPATVNSSGPERLSQGEKVLNWQTENAIAQNRMLTTINNKVDRLAQEHRKRTLTLQDSIKEIHERLNTLHIEMMSMANNMLCNTSMFQSKESEMKNLKNQLRDLRSMQRRQFTDPFDTSLFGSMPSRSQQSFLFGHSSQRTSSTQHSFLSSDERYTSRYARPKLPEFQLRKQNIRKNKDPTTSSQPVKKPSLSSSSSQDSQGSATTRNQERR